jgi:hypothetical protein
VEQRLWQGIFRIAQDHTDVVTEMQAFAGWLAPREAVLVHSLSRDWFKPEPNILNTSRTFVSTDIKHFLLADIEGTFPQSWARPERLTLPTLTSSSQSLLERTVPGIQSDLPDVPSMNSRHLLTFPLSSLPSSHRLSDSPRTPSDPDIDIGAGRTDDGNDREQGSVQGQSSVAGENNGEEDDAMEGGSVTGKDVEGNDGERADIEMDVLKPASVAGEVEGNGGVEDGVYENGGKDYDMDALPVSSITEEDDDGGDFRKADEESKAKKEGKPPSRNLKRARTKGRNVKAGSGKETAIDVDAFFVSSPFIGLNWFLNSSLLACRRHYLRT